MFLFLSVTFVSVIVKHKNIVIFYLLKSVDPGNNSDNLEVVSDGASNHSVPSSVELDQDQNDNLSDMVSANVSGRGTPNISGLIKFILN